MIYTYYAVEVPIRNLRTPGRKGVHVLAGRAESRSAAVEAAQEAYDMARLASESGAEIPLPQPDGWEVRAYRPGWEPDWTAAIAHPCGYTFSWPTADAVGW
ncbi:hypothetical protein AB0D30_30835 [Streptomyces sp. NPDC048409]|uniref:hypothetical protein n=1 Tax=Streptomyces sp. NPDC048409 TaxID=3154723 RepID=UPI0034495860